MNDERHPLDAKRLEAFQPTKARTGRPAGPGRGHKGEGKGTRPPSGPGWGGKASGRSVDFSDPAFHAERRAKALAKRALSPEQAQALAANKAALVDEALAVIATIMRDSEYEANRLNAAAKLRAEIVGAPMQRVMRAETTPENLVDQLEIEALTPEQRDALRDIANALLERRTSSLPGPKE